MSKGVALFVLLPVLALHMWTSWLVKAGEDGFCLSSVSLANAVGFEQGSRRIPARTPALAAYDWDLQTHADQDQLTTHYKPCHAEAPIFRYKVAQGVIYVDHDHADARYKPYRDGFMEQLVLAMWLYSDFPVVDLVVDFTDHPQLCDQGIPFLRFSTFNSSILGNPQQQLYNLTELLAPGWITSEYVSKVTAKSPQAAAADHAAYLLPYTRGFTIPSPEAWRALSLTPVQLAEYTKCLQETHPWNSKRHVVFWRGAATGCSRGWPLHPQAATAAAAPLSRPHLLRNKRVQMVLRLFPYPDRFDVGITSMPRFTAECLGVNGHARQRRALLGAPLAPHRRSGGPIVHVPGGGSPHKHAIEEHKPGMQLQEGANAADDSKGSRSEGIHPLMMARAFRAMTHLLHKEGVGMEGWADAVATLSIDGYGPAYRLPQQLLLPAAVLKQQSPYQAWLDWELHPGVHYEQFAYDLADVERRGFGMLGAEGASASGGVAGVSDRVAAAKLRLQEMAEAARAAVAAKVNIFAQLDAFAWSIARYKEVCPWAVAVPAPGDTAWRVLQLDPSEVFNAKAVAEAVRLRVMRHLQRNFATALKHPAYASAMDG